jgi:hypothetical protein
VLQKPHARCPLGQLLCCFCGVRAVCGCALNEAWLMEVSIGVLNLQLQADGSRELQKRSEERRALLDKAIVPVGDLLALLGQRKSSCR